MTQQQSEIQEICSRHGNDRSRMLDVVREVQGRFGSVSGPAMDLIAREMGTHRVEVESVVSFYAFLSSEPGGQVVIRLCNDVVDKMHGSENVAEVFEKELGVKRGETTADGRISLTETACIGMSDQAPAALINDVVITHLSTDTAREIVGELRKGAEPSTLIKQLGGGNNAHDLVGAMVENNIRLAGPVIFAEYESGEALHKALSMTPAEVIRNVKTARLRGRGGAGFPAGMKWEFTRAAKGDRRFLICNADEGEPGTFKDRVILTERPGLLFEGMTIGGYAIGASEGILYLRAEYAYLREFLESVLAERRRAGLLGSEICGNADFSFDIRIQMGAGAYVCGEETALISSCEGLRGDPKNRPPFPAQRGYQGCPTSVNNVETLCCVTRIIEKGSAWFSEIGSHGSAGTKLLSISGDCKRPGIYEIAFGTPLRDILKLAGATDVQAVQVGGPSGQMVGPEDFERTICFDDLATGGSMVIFGPGRDLLEIVDGYLEFFIDESCGYCTPCRVGNVLIQQCLEKIRAGKGEAADLDYLKELAETVKRTSRCGLGQTSPNPVLSTLEHFRSLYEARLTSGDSELRSDFDLERSVRQAAALAGRESSHVQH
ncbi:MAG: NAD(P)H-dependent oxidoreductase subunit E [Acidobacteriota bacterium]